MNLREQFAIEILKTLISNKQITNIDWGVYIAHSINGADKLVNKLLEPPTENIKAVPKKYIVDLDLTKRLTNILTNAGHHTIQDVFNALEFGGINQFKKYRNCGAHSVNELIEILHDNDIIITSNCCYKKAN